MAWRSRSRSIRAALALGALCVTGAGAYLRFLSPRALDGVSFSQEVVDRHGKLLRLTLAGDEKYRVYTRLEEVSPAFVQALLLLEDRHYYRHPGVNPLALARGLGSWLHGRARMGGSTLTMQLARVRYGLRTRTIPGKLAQIATALRLELRQSKHDLLEAYLNVAPFGANVEGIGAASLIYFGKRPAQLTLGESLLLAVIPQNPTQRSLAGGGTQLAPGAAAARARLLARWLERHPRDRERLTDLELPVVSQRLKALPFAAPHAVEMALQESPRALRVRTTLDAPLQAKIESRLRDYVRAHRGQGVRNAAALLVDTASGEVLSLVGSADYADDTIEGQVNGVLARRSPGSTLKPFVYGLGLMQGLIHPRTLLKDTPRSFGGFDPENYDRRFAGPLPAEQALIESRNVPAVALAQQLKDPTLYEFLRHAGIRLPQPERFYGLGLALGGAEISMWELASLYAMLARRGEWEPLRIVPERKAPAMVPLLSPESAFVTLQMLARNPRPDRPFAPGMTLASYPAAWKTGTSFGFRDAWTAGIVGPYALVVWLGNFDGEGNPAFMGRDLAGPLFFGIADAIADPTFAYPAWYLDRSGLNVKKVEVCSVSGHLPGKHCPHRVETWFIPGASPIAQCTIHRQILVDRVTGKRLCGLPSASARLETFEFWPSDLLELFAAAGIARRPPPPFAAACPLEERGAQGHPPEIVSPRDGVEYMMSAAARSKDARDEIPLRAVVDADAKRLFWFANQRFVGESRPDVPLLFRAGVGDYTVSAVDDLGRSDSRRLVVRATR